jgi:signal transduction histidine kinase
VNLQKAWAAALIQKEALIQEKGALIEIDPDLPDVRGYEPILIQVLSNLLSNALKFMAPGITPRVHFGASPPKGNTVCLWVRDNGIGIPAQHQERIFGMFERLHETEYAGTGIGLSIVRKGIERMGGKAGVISSPNQGSRFWIELPQA